MSSIALNGITIGYDDAGQGQVPVVFVHGHPFDRSMWAPQVRAISEAGYRAIAPDLRGYGQSSVVPGKATLDIFARDIASLLDRLDTRKAVLCGLSMGGQIVMEFARQFPERLRGIVLAATFPRADTEDGKRIRLDTADRLVREGMAEYAREFLPKMLAAGSIARLPAVAEHVMRMMQGAPAQGSAAALRGRAERPDYDGVLAGLDVPALIVVGDEDAFTTRADAEHMHDLLRDSELVWMKGIGHMPNLEREADFNAALVRFLDRVVRAEH
jgi:pimeloyl-ACP methyl ester carboxylesterase